MEYPDTLQRRRRFQRNSESALLCNETICATEHKNSKEGVLMDYRLIRSKRKTIGIQVKNGMVIVRAPMRTSLKEIDAFVERSRNWIDKHLCQQEEQMAREAENPISKLTREELEALAQEAVRRIPGRVAYYAPKVGVTYGNITIRNQRTRWGSCSAKGNLNFNCLLCLAPPGVLDAVVVHELCHRLEMNHSKRFYEEVLRVYPDYYKDHGWLKEHGSELLGRLP